MDFIGVFLIFQFCAETSTETLPTTWPSGWCLLDPHRTVMAAKSSTAFGEYGRELRAKWSCMAALGDWLPPQETNISIFIRWYKIQMKKGVNNEWTVPSIRIVVDIICYTPQWHTTGHVAASQSTVTKRGKLDLLHYIQLYFGYQRFMPCILLYIWSLYTIYISIRGINSIQDIWHIMNRTQTYKSYKSYK